jgi:exopolysaccharide production protein ExoY
MTFVEHPLQRSPATGARGLYLGMGKRLFDVGFAFLLMPIWLPLVVLFWVLAVLETGTGGYCDRRIGRNGQAFNCLKIRTLQGRVSRQCVAEKAALDRRSTPLGAILRRASLDELPQFWCVLKGEMSIVGPRPVPAKELARYGVSRSSYLRMRPGITGLWQVSGRNALCYSTRVALDVEYSRSVSLMLDLKIIGTTVFEIFKLSGR